MGMEMGHTLHLLQVRKSDMVENWMISYLIPYIYTLNLHKISIG